MDYKKKYEEAQKWVESIYPEMSHERQMEAEAFFPELAESEDEKMLNQLHSWMMEFGGAEEYTEKVYCWLKNLIEKQGEQKEVLPYDVVQKRLQEHEKKIADICEKSGLLQIVRELGNDALTTALQDAMIDLTLRTH